MGVLKIRFVLIAAASVLALSCSSRHEEKAAAKVDEAPIVESALKLQGERKWADAETVWNKFALSSPYFSRAYLETQKLSYRTENWRVFFAKAELYKNLFHDSFICPDLYLLQSFALTRNCYFKEAEESLKGAEIEAARVGLPRCRAARANFGDQVSELRSVLRAQQKIKIAGRDVLADTFKRNLWPANDRVLAKVKQLPLEQGLAFVGVDISNRCPAEGSKQ